MKLLLLIHGIQVNVPKTRRTYCKGKDCKYETRSSTNPPNST